MNPSPLEGLYIEDIFQETFQVDAQMRISKALGKDPGDG